MTSWGWQSWYNYLLGACVVVVLLLCIEWRRPNDDPYEDL